MTEPKSRNSEAIGKAMTAAVEELRRLGRHDTAMALTYAIDLLRSAPVSETQRSDHATKIINTYEAALESIAVYKGEGTSMTPWQDIVRDLGRTAREALALAKEIAHG